MCTISGDWDTVTFCVAEGETLLVVPLFEQAVDSKMTTSDGSNQEKREALFDMRAFIVYAIFPALLTNPRSLSGKIAVS
jgi:hypothetical protein